MQLVHEEDRQQMQKKYPIYDNLISSFGNTASFKGIPGALTTTLLQGKKML